MADALIIAIIGYAVQYGIPAAQALIDTWSKDNPTEEDWKAAFEKAKTYQEYVGPKPS